VTSTLEPIDAERGRDDEEAGHARRNMFTILSPWRGMSTGDTMATHPCNLTGISHNARTISMQAEMQCIPAVPRAGAHVLESCGYLDTQAMPYILLSTLAASSTDVMTCGSLLLVCIGRSLWIECMDLSGRRSTVHPGLGHACVPGHVVPMADVERVFPVMCSIPALLCLVFISLS
jgi:hypothetical protein